MKDRRVKSFPYEKRLDGFRIPGLEKKGTEWRGVWQKLIKLKQVYGGMTTEQCCHMLVQPMVWADRTQGTFDMEAWQTS